MDAQEAKEKTCRGFSRFSIDIEEIKKGYGLPSLTQIYYIRRFGRVGVPAKER